MFKKNITVQTYPFNQLLRILITFLYFPTPSAIGNKNQKIYNLIALKAS